MDISTVAPMRKPSRMPFFTHGFTRQPVAVDESGSAARISPEFSASLNSANNRTSPCPYSPGFSSKSFSILSRSMDVLEQPDGFERAANFRQFFGLRRHEGPPPGGLAHPHQRYRGFYGNGFRLHEIRL